MKQMTEYQRELVCENLVLVEQTIRKRINVRGVVLLTYDDFYQIGCEALCKAAMEYKPEIGLFAPLACRSIYNALVDHCRKQNALLCLKYPIAMEDDNDNYSLMYMSVTVNLEEQVYCQDLRAAFENCKSRYDGITLRGIEAMELKSMGFTSREIADRYETTINNVNAWISRARSRLRVDPVFAPFAP